LRALAVNHWLTPVVFTRFIESLHRDGVRLFVECGPRGNLSAFVEDILRGKPFAAVPANVPRKSGPTQINHMVAQLVAHGVDLNLGYLYAGPTPPAPLPEGKGEEEPSYTADVNESSAPSTPSLLGGGWGVGLPAPDLMHGYLDTMERFLDTQREVMAAFLGRPIAPSSLSELPPIEFALPPVADAPGSPEVQEKPYCLVESIVRHIPGQEIVFRRVLDEREDRYADDHTLGGRGVSRADPGQNGLPVLPMTFSLEAMSEAASLLAPGKIVVAIRNVRLFRWLPFDPGTTTLEVRAQVASVDPETGVVEVKADVRDLGNSFLRDGAGKAASEAVVVLADRYPDPVAPLPFQLTDEVACKSTVEDLRRNMFHGPLFQMIRTRDTTGREGL
jgi:malonyl CoA-acyl carrier protein transacylase